MVTTRGGSITSNNEPGQLQGKKHKAEGVVAVGEEESDKKKAKPASKKASATRKKEDKNEIGGKKATVEDAVNHETDTKGHNHEHSGDSEMQDVESPVTVEESRDRKVVESPIVEKGLVYFFLRGKVDIEHPESIDEVKRSYMVLRPLPLGTKLADRKIEDGGKNRLLAIPKKRLPVKGYEKFLTFVEEPEASLKDLRMKYLKGRTYQTKTVGERTDFPAQPVGEGVYAITKSENERQSHFAYILTVPEIPNELQNDLGLRQKGSFVISVRNPTTPAPPNAGIPDPAEYPKEIMDEFRGLRWGPVRPKHLDYKNAEVLFIGEKNFPQDGDYKATGEELNLLEDEDEKRVMHLKGGEAVFADLELSKKEFLSIQTTWG